MDIDDNKPPTGLAPETTTTTADHLCVLVHGLWGNPSHLDFIASSLRDRHSEDRLHILAATRNTGNFTYDGIELGGERLTHEIEETLDKLKAEGHQVTKLSIVGYSLGGLVARYAVGLLYARGWFDKLEPVNFTTFASPHVGARRPLKGLQSYLWNSLGPRVISMSGRQLFMVDSFRDTGRPLLSILADQDSIFIQALTRFKHRSIYANVVNDRSTSFYATFISTGDLFQDPERARITYVKGYEPVIVDVSVEIDPSIPPEHEPPVSLPLATRIRQWTSWVTSNIRPWLFLLLFFSIALPLFLMSSVLEGFRSRQRIRLHEEGKSGITVRHYRVPFLVQNAMEEAFENINAGQSPEYLSDTEEVKNRQDMRLQPRTPSSNNSTLLSKQHRTPKPNGNISTNPSISDPEDLSSEDSGESGADGKRHRPRLALTADQFSIVESLNSVGFRKYPVYIHNHRHSHAAIIVRAPKKEFDEGKLVIQHWLDKEFEI
ncbi:hypothetical protein FE257_012461 [Aspergillus nanangensis]|uniref:DUF676 domain-containing protein n=1 Tax=Aspergillus nanangensis TaxID=2582783 RepID=A0AAD4GXT1_ASPNN|nr:hypothetical protein FE257_012461 [Aspergillus nanangensis]